MSSLNLIALLDLYLILTFIVSTAMRYRQYRTIMGFILAVPERWPRLFVLAHGHKTVFLTWPTLVPVGLTLSLMLVHTMAYNLVWPQARVTPADLWQHWISLACVLGLLGPMLYLDFDAIFNIWEFDRAALERDLAQAEFWLRSWVAPVVSVVTFGFVNPRKMVHEEVRKALTDACLDVNKMMWRWSLQIAARLAFGLSLWLTWAIVVRAPHPP